MKNELKWTNGLDQINFSWDAKVNNLCKKAAHNNSTLSELPHYIPQKTFVPV